MKQVFTASDAVKAASPSFLSRIHYTHLFELPRLGILYINCLLALYGATVIKAAAKKV